MESSVVAVTDDLTVEVVEADPEEYVEPAPGLPVVRGRYVDDLFISTDSLPVAIGGSVSSGIPGSIDDDKGESPCLEDGLEFGAPE